VLSADELERYRRQIILPEIGEKGQEKLKKARVFVAGVGGLGSPASMYLVAAGVGNPEVKVDSLKLTISADNVIDLLRGYDLIVDAMDNLQTRYLLNDAAFQLGIPFIHGAIQAFEGRAMTVIPGRTACLMCLYHGATVNQKIPVVGATAGVIACIQATEAIKYITGIGELLTNRLLIYDGLNMRFSEIRINRNPECDHCKDTGETIR
jgi:molybdopterin/thiamine biosynthesis adenylyltransferase